MHPNQNKGIAAGISAGIFWGTPFFIPIVLADFSAFEIMFGRFAFFGLMSLFYLPQTVRLLKSVTVKEIFHIFLLSAAGYWFYTLMLFSGIQLTNGVVSSLIIGCIPLTITLFSKPNFNGRFFFRFRLYINGHGFFATCAYMERRHRWVYS